MFGFGDLIARLGWDSRAFDAGMAKAQVKSDLFSKSLQSFGNRMISSFIALFSLEAIISFGREMARIAKEAQQISAQFRISTEEAQQLKQVADEMGVSVDQLVRGGKDLAEALDLASSRDPMFSADEVKVFTASLEEAKKTAIGLGGFLASHFRALGMNFADPKQSFVESAGRTIEAMLPVTHLTKLLEKLTGKELGKGSVFGTSDKPSGPGSLLRSTRGLLPGFTLLEKKINDMFSRTEKKRSEHEDFIHRQRLRIIDEQLKAERFRATMVGLSEKEKLAELKKQRKQTEEEGKDRISGLEKSFGFAEKLLAKIKDGEMGGEDIDPLIEKLEHDLQRLQSSWEFVDQDKVADTERAINVLKNEIKGAKIAKGGEAAVESFRKAIGVDRKELELSLSKMATGIKQGQERVDAKNEKKDKTGKSPATVSDSLIAIGNMLGSNPERAEAQRTMAMQLSVTKKIEENTRPRTQVNRNLPPLQ